MNFEGALLELRHGKKIRRKCMEDKKTYLQIVKSCVCFPTKHYEDKLILVFENTPILSLNLHSEDILATDWELYDGDITKVNMTAAAFSIVCPDCGRGYVINGTLDETVGKKHTCYCGTKLECSTHTEVVDNDYTTIASKYFGSEAKIISSWPEAK